MSSHFSSGIAKYSSRKWLIPATLFLVCYLLFVQLAKTDYQYVFGDWKSEIYADKSGYYIYLPATFIYGYHQTGYPDSIDFKLGNGFGFVKGRVFTKYTYGVALMASPFFLATHCYQSISGTEANGFNNAYLSFPGHASVFYLLAGLAALFVFLRRRFSLFATVSALVMLTFGTNLYYYTFQEPLMSHVYSFALFSFLMLLTDNYLVMPDRRTLAGIALVSALITLIRPTNIIFLTVVICLDVQSWSKVRERLKILFSTGNMLVISGLFILIWLPQMAYWKFMSGSFLFYTYKGEGFTNWLNPQIPGVLFAPKNGLFTYVPAFFLLLTGLVQMLLRNKANGRMIGILFIFQLYIISSWHLFSFGCSFGQRSFVEFFSLFSVPLAVIYDQNFRPPRIYPLMILLLISSYFIFFNLRMSASYARCFDGKNWDWELFREQLVRAEVFPLPGNVFYWKNDFETTNLHSTAGINIKEVNNAFSGNKVNILAGNNRFSDGFELRPGETGTGKIYSIVTSMQLYLNKPAEGASFACSLENQDTTLFFETRSVDPDRKLPLKTWTLVEESFEIPFLEPVGRLRIYLMTNKSEDMLIDDFTVSIYSEKN
ncbi:MAG: hypothetical protein V1775_16890 [Bacteroidota bacterium]